MPNISSEGLDWLCLIEVILDDSSVKRRIAIRLQEMKQDGFTEKALVEECKRGKLVAA